MAAQTAPKGEAVPPIQLIDGEGAFQTDVVQSFVTEHKLADVKNQYQVVAIMGPQSSGKSTLMNYVFGTSFTMMDAMTGRRQTTKGIWVAKSPKISELVTLVMDLEGNDGRERGEDDTNFERQTALFALSVADILLVNIWCHDIGREQGSGKPLLKTIFQVNLKLFAPDPNRKKSVLLFVIRDKTKTPLAKLVEVLEADLDRMWDSISKPPQYKESKLKDFFEVQYTALPHYEEKHEDFVADAVMLRRRFTPDGDETLVRSDDKLPGDAFALSVRNIWDIIRSQKDLNLPAHKIMVANIRCAEIKEDQIRAMVSDQAWQTLQEEVKAGRVVQGFGARAQSLVESCVSGYEAEAAYFDAKVRKEKGEELSTRLEALLKPLVVAQTAALHEAQLSEAKKDLTVGLASGKEGFAAVAARVGEASETAFSDLFQSNVRVPMMPWDGQEELAAFNKALEEHITSLRSERIQEAVSKAERQLASLLSGPVITLLDSCPKGLWPRLYAVAKDASGSAEKPLLQALEGFALSPEEQGKLKAQLAGSAQSRLQGHVREAALTRISRMKDKFTEVFTLDQNKTPRLWSRRDDIPAIAREARLAAANVLAQLAVIRPDTPSTTRSAKPGQEGEAHVADVVEEAVLRLARQDLQQEAASTSGAESGSGSSSAAALARSNSLDILSAATWPNVNEDDVLLQPHEVRTAWREFMSSSNAQVQQALTTQQANKAQSQLPPLWALGAMVILGWNELMALVWNPLYLLLGMVLVLFARTLYFELDVDAEMAKGSLPGAISLANKFVPALKSVVHKTIESIMQAIAPAEGGAPQGARAQQYRVQEPSIQMSELPHGGPPNNASAAGLTRRKPAAEGFDGVGSTPAQQQQADSRKDQ